MGLGEGRPKEGGIPHHTHPHGHAPERENKPGARRKGPGGTGHKRQTNNKPIAEAVAVGASPPPLIYTAADVTNSTAGPRLYLREARVFTEAYIGLTTDPSGTLTFLVKKNGTTVLTGTATTYKGNTVSGSVAVSPGDYLTVTISAAGGATGAGVVVIS